MKKRTRMLICLLLSLALAGTASAAAAAQEKAHGFATQEACAQALVQALRDGDPEAYLNCFAIAETARSVNMAALLEMLQRMHLLDFKQPSDAWAAAYNEWKIKDDLLFSLFWTLHPDSENRVFARSQYTLEQVLELRQIGSALDNLSYQEMLDPKLVFENYNTKGARESIARQNGYYGYKSRDEKILVLDLDGRMFYMGACFVPYDAGWLLSPIAYSWVKSLLGMVSLQLMIPAEEVPEVQRAVPTQGLEERVGRWSEADGQFLLPGRISWQSSASDVRAYLGEKESDQSGAGETPAEVFSIEPISWDEVQSNPRYYFRQGKLAALAQEFAHLYGRRNILYAELCYALSKACGEANITDFSLVLPCLQALESIPAEAIPEIEASLWQAWMLPDQNTLVFVFNQDKGGMGVAYFNSGRLKAQ